MQGWQPGVLACFEGQEGESSWLASGMPVAARTDPRPPPQLTPFPMPSRQRHPARLTSCHPPRASFPTCGKRTSRGCCAGHSTACACAQCPEGTRGTGAACVGAGPTPAPPAPRPAAARCQRAPLEARPLPPTTPAPMPAEHTGPLRRPGRAHPPCSTHALAGPAPAAPLPASTSSGPAPQPLAPGARRSGPRGGCAAAGRSTVAPLRAPAPLPPAQGEERRVRPEVSRPLPARRRLARRRHSLLRLLLQRRDGTRCGRSGSC